jgi:hypothetical protein
MVDIDVVIAAHDRHHERLRELLFLTLECLVVVDVDGARERFGTFVRELQEGLALEDEWVLPAYRDRQPATGPGRAIHVEGDHVILRRGIEYVMSFLDEVSASPSLRVVLEGLPHVYRLLGTLEHHTERERRHVYPVAVPALDDDGQRRLGAALCRLAGDTGLP